MDRWAMGGVTGIAVQLGLPLLLLVLVWRIVRGRRGRSAAARSSLLHSPGGFTCGNKIVLLPAMALWCLAIMALVLLPSLALIGGRPLSAYIGFALFGLGILVGLYGVVAVASRMLVPVAPAWARPVLRGSGPPPLAADPAWDGVREELTATLRTTLPGAGVELRSPLGRIVVAPLRAEQWGLDVSEAGSWMPSSWWDCVGLTRVPRSEHRYCELAAPAEGAARAVAVCRLLGFTVADAHPATVTIGGQAPEDAAALALALA